MRRDKDGFVMLYPVIKNGRRSNKRTLDSLELEAAIMHLAELLAQMESKENTENKDLINDNKKRSRLN